MKLECDQYKYYMTFPYNSIVGLLLVSRLRHSGQQYIDHLSTVKINYVHFRRASLMICKLRYISLANSMKWQTIYQD